MMSGNLNTNLARAQFLADEAFDVLMTNPHGSENVADRVERPITERERERVKLLMALSQAYSQLAVGVDSEKHIELTEMLSTQMLPTTGKVEGGL